MIDGETELRFCGKVCKDVRAQVGRPRRICCHRLGTGLSMSPKRSAIGTIKFEAPEECYQAFSEFAVVGDMIGNMGSAHLLGLIAAEP